MVNVIFWNGLGFFFLGFLIPFVAAIELNATGSQMGIVFSIRTVGYFIVAPFAGVLADRMSNKFLVLLGSYGRGLSILVYSGVALNLLLFIVITVTTILC